MIIKAQFKNLYSLRPYKKSLFPVTVRITFQRCVNKNFNFYFVEFEVFDTKQQFWGDSRLIWPHFDEDTFFYNFGICLYDQGRTWFDFIDDKK